ncbi:TRAP transporter fused permease subunit [Anderseniella sp. Alg231-50]|uniref:TRAP transporter fused permease subunit n=1 Tax=Anderseniella sp. Alg231-50 TaxID=1922226 RepID=UPI000D54C188
MAAEQELSKADALVAEVETGGRNLSGSTKNLIPIICFVWAIYQLYISSPLPAELTVSTGISFFQFIGNLSISRKIHLMFALVLACLAFPLYRGAPTKRIPLYDWVLIALGSLSILYMVVMDSNIANRAGDFAHENIRIDMTVAVIGMVALALSVYRSLGLPLVIVAAILMGYAYIGGGNWGGASFVKGTWHFWMQEEGVFGKPLAVSTQMIFLFVLFGSILEKAGAGGYFIKIAFALLGSFRGGPAKAAVIASALSGLYSGSSIANTVTTGTFTIPLMKRTGLSAEKAGAVEVASSTNGQLTPPVMGAAAFLIAEFTGVEYTTLLKHALIPAIVSYIALIYIVHLEACKLNLQGIPKPKDTIVRTLAQKMIGFLTGFLVLAFLFIAVYYTLGFIKEAYPGISMFSVIVISGIAYLVLAWFASKRPDLETDDPDAPMTVLPKAADTAWTGLYYILPIVILLWCILPTPDRLSPSTAAFFACLAMSFIALTQHIIKGAFRGNMDLASNFRKGLSEWVDGMIAGARNMISIGIATAAAGVIVGAISLTGAHAMVGELVEFLSGGVLIVMLLLVAVMSLILGMGLPTTANYLVVSSLMAPVIVALGAKSGLIVPLVAVHLFVFYFGILADDTPPVGLAAYAAAAISKGDPIKTGVQGFMYDIRTALLPFLFLFNTDLLLINVGPMKALFVFVVATIAMMLFASATQGWFFTRNRMWETVALLAIALTLFRPGLLLDRVSPPFDERPGVEALKLAEAAPDGGTLRVRLVGPDFDDIDENNSTFLELNLGASGDGETRFTQSGLNVLEDDGKVAVDGLTWDSKLKHLDKLFTMGDLDKPLFIEKVLVKRDRMPKEVFYIPALLLLGLIIFLQRRRHREDDPDAEAKAAAA